MGKKKKTFIFSLIGSIIALVLFNSRDVGLCYIYCGSGIDRYQDIFLFFPVLLLLSAATLFTKESVFNAWWKFAQFAIPAVLLVSFVVSLELHHNPGGWFNIDNEIDFSILSLTYLIFIFGSALQMYRGFRQKA